MHHVPRMSIWISSTPAWQEAGARLGLRSSEEAEKQSTMTCPGITSGLVCSRAGSRARAGKDRAHPGAQQGVPAASWMVPRVKVAGSLSCRAKVRRTEVRDQAGGRRAGPEPHSRDQGRSKRAWRDTGMA